MANRINLDAVCSHLVSRLDTLLTPATPTGLGLKAIQYGDLMYLPAEVLSGLTAKLPAIFVKPATWRTVRAPGIQSFSSMLLFRLVYVRAFTTTEAVVQTKVQHLEKIGETLLDEYNLPQLSISGVTVVATRLVEANAQPPEDDIVVATMGANVTAASVDFEVELEASV